MATLKKVPILAGLGDYELAQIADAATTNEHAADEVIIKQVARETYERSMGRYARCLRADLSMTQKLSAIDTHSALHVLHTRFWFKECSNHCSCFRK